MSGARNSKSKCCYNAKPSTYYFLWRQRYLYIFRPALVYLWGLSLWRIPNCQNLSKGCDISSDTTRVAPATPTKSPSNSIIYSCQKICSWTRRTETILEIKNKVTFLEAINKPIIYKFSKILLTTERKRRQLF